VGALVPPLSLVTAVLADHPVSTLTAPIASAADQVVAGIAGAVVNTVTPVTVPPGSGQSGGGPSASGPPLDAAAPPPAAVLPFAAATSGFDAWREALPAAAPASGAVSGSSGGAPGGGSDLPSPGSPSGVLSAGSAGSAGPGSAPGFAALGGNGAGLASALGARAGLPADDDLPTAPVFDHDISPD
jgi:hypothetical protein